VVCGRGRLEMLSRAVTPSVDSGKVRDRGFDAVSK
jgi:hypothetical protein